MQVERDVVEVHTDDLKSRLTVIPAQIYLTVDDKHLILSINSHQGTAATDIRKIENRPSIPGSTTLVYRRAREIMKEAASILQYPIDYKFQTRNANMIGWALDKNKGMSIFNWDKWWENEEFVALKVINP